MKKTLKNILVPAGFFLAGALAGIVHFTGPTRETSCMAYIEPRNDTDGHQRIVTEGGTFGRGVGFNTSEIEKGREYRWKLKRYDLGLSEEYVIGATECFEDFTGFQTE